MTALALAVAAMCAVTAGLALIADRIAGTWEG